MGSFAASTDFGLVDRAYTSVNADGRFGLTPLTLEQQQDAHERSFFARLLLSTPRPMISIVMWPTSTQRSHYGGRLGSGGGLMTIGALSSVGCRYNDDAFYVPIVYPYRRWIFIIKSYAA